MVTPLHAPYTKGMLNDTARTAVVIGDRKSTCGLKMTNVALPRSLHPSPQKDPECSSSSLNALFPPPTNKQTSMKEAHPTTGGCLVHGVAHCLSHCFPVNSLSRQTWLTFHGGSQVLRFPDPGTPAWEVFSVSPTCPKHPSKKEAKQSLSPKP